MNVLVDLKDGLDIQSALALHVGALLEALHFLDEELSREMRTVGVLKEWWRNLAISLGYLKCVLEKKISMRSSEEWSI